MLVHQKWRIKVAIAWCPCSVLHSTERSDRGRRGWGGKAEAYFIWEQILLAGKSTHQWFVEYVTRIFWKYRHCTAGHYCALRLPSVCAMAQRLQEPEGGTPKKIFSFSRGWPGVTQPRKRIVLIFCTRLARSKISGKIIGTIRWHHCSDITVTLHPLVVFQWNWPKFHWLMIWCSSYSCSTCGEASKARITPNERPESKDMNWFWQNIHVHHCKFERLKSVCGGSST